MNVWTIDRVGYPDETYLVGIAASEEAALDLLKNVTYGSPYLVTWTEKRTDDEALEVTGDFASVPGYACPHNAIYRIAVAEIYGA